MPLRKQESAPGTWRMGSAMISVIPQNTLQRTALVKVSSRVKTKHSPQRQLRLVQVSTKKHLILLTACPSACTKCTAAAGDNVECEECEHGFFLVDSSCKGNEKFLSRMSQRMAR